MFAGFNWQQMISAFIATFCRDRYYRLYTYYN